MTKNKYESPLREVNQWMATLSSTVTQLDEAKEEFIKRGYTKCAEDVEKTIDIFNEWCTHGFDCYRLDVLMMALINERNGIHGKEHTNYLCEAYEQNRGYAALKAADYDMSTDDDTA